MPKKFKGENSKAVGAKERKATKAAEAKEQVERTAEDARWKDDDKSIAKKNQRKEEREKKRLEEAQRKQENRLLVQQEEAATQGGAGKPAAPPPKVTRFQVQQQRQQADAAAAVAAAAATAPATPSTLLVENTNKLEDVVSASGVDDAIKALSMNDAGCEGGERVSMAAAFRAFEEQNMSRLKKDNPTLKLSQLKQRLRKEWQRSPDNPLNQARLGCS